MPGVSNSGVPQPRGARASASGDRRWPPGPTPAAPGPPSSQPPPTRLGPTVGPAGTLSLGCQAGPRAVSDVRGGAMRGLCRHRKRRVIKTKWDAGKDPSPGGAVSPEAALALPPPPSGPCAPTVAPPRWHWSPWSGAQGLVCPPGSVSPPPASLLTEVRSVQVGRMAPLNRRVHPATPHICPPACAALEAGSPESRRQRGRTLSKTLGDNPSLTSPSFGGSRCPLAVATLLHSLPPWSPGLLCSMCLS